jgi:hypothetical protein
MSVAAAGHPQVIASGIGSGRNHDLLAVGSGPLALAR